MLGQITSQTDRNWKEKYVKERRNQLGKSSDLSSTQLPIALRKNLIVPYEFDNEEDSDMRSTAITEESAKRFYNTEIENLKILVHVLNEKLESTSKNYSDQIDEIMYCREQMKRLKQLEDENQDIINENINLQNKIDELLDTIETAFDKIDSLVKDIEDKDIEMSKLKAQLPNVQLLEKYKSRISELEKEVENLKIELLRAKAQAGEMLKKINDLKALNAPADAFSLDYFVIGRFIRIIEKETLSHFRVRLKNQDSKDTGLLKYDKVKKVLSDLGVTPQDMLQLMRLAGF